MKFSIIIAALNEEKMLSLNKDFFERLKRYLRAELIIVDGGSTDNTVDVAKSLTENIYFTQPLRSRQFNIGAINAKGNYLIFLHADTKIDKLAMSNIKIIKQDYSWGFLKIKLDGKDIKYKFLSICINLRSRIFNYATGDQVLVIKKTLFNQLNGFKEISLMEDIELVDRLKNITNPTFINGAAITSVRRWEKFGFLTTILRMRYLRLLYYLGVNPKKLIKMYK